MVKRLRWLPTILATVMLGTLAFAQTALPGGALSSSQIQTLVGWSSNGTTTSTSLGMQVSSGFNILSASPNVIRSGGSNYINMEEATGGGSIELSTPLGGSRRIRLLSDIIMIGVPLTYADFTDDSATTGNRTVNTSRGFNAFAAAATAITITNSNVTTSSQIYATIMTNDATAVLKNCVPAAGSFTCNLNAAATGTTKIAWTVVK